MSYSPASLRAIIRAVLQQLDASIPGMYSPAAEELHLVTAAHESHLGYWRRQDGGGPGRGIYQQEPRDLLDCYRYMARRTDIGGAVAAITGYDAPSLLALQYDPVYATAVARVHFWMVPDPLPAADDLWGLACYWDKHWNRNPIKGFPQIALENYRRLVAV